MGKLEEDLMTAITNENFKKVKKLVDQGADVNYEGRYGTPLSYAVTYSQLEIVKLLLEKGAKTNLGDVKNSSLINAVSSGNVKILDVLIKKGGDINRLIPRIIEFTTIDAKKRKEVFKALIKGGLKIEKVKSEHYTPLMIAAIANDLEFVKKLIKKTKNIDERNEDGESALSFASESGNLEIVKFLIKRGADIKQTDNSKRTLLIVTCRSKIENLELVKYLIEKGVKVDQKDTWGNTALIESTFGTKYEKSKDFDAKKMIGSFWVKDAKIETMKVLLENGADINSRDEMGRTTLRRAVGRKNIPAIKFLLKHGADGTIPDDKGETPIMNAYRTGYYNMVKALETGGKLSEQDKLDIELFARGAYYGKVSTIRELLDKGAKIDTKFGSALMTACSNNKVHAAKYLIEKGADIEAKSYGFTVLLVACEKGYFKIVKLLVEKGADINATNDDWNVLKSSLMDGHEKIAKYLIKKGVSEEIRTDSIFDAVVNGHEKIVELLVKKGVNSKSEIFKKAIEHAKKYGFEKSLKILKRAKK